jgi:hypothetical protein
MKLSCRNWSGPHWAKGDTLKSIGSGAAAARAPVEKTKRAKSDARSAAAGSDRKPKSSNK